MIEITYLGAMLAGGLSFLTPCVLPLVPPYLCFIGGVSLERMTAEEGVPADLLARIFLAAIAFVLGFSTVFIGFGATASAFGQLIGDYLDILAKVAGVVIVLLGLHFMGVFKATILYREARVHIENKPAGLIGAYIIGLAFAFGWTPCVGPVLAAVLFVAGSEDSAFYGASLLAAYSAGLGIPFLGAALAVKPFMGFMARFRRHLQTVERVIGALLVGTGILFLTDSFNVIGYWLLETFPELAFVG